MSAPRFQLVPGARLAGPLGHAGVGWRLLGANNRELGRCAEALSDAEDAVRSINAIRELAAHAISHINHNPSTGVWTWWLEGPDGGIAVSGRGFRHERECRYNLEQFREAAPTAPASQDAPEEFPWQRSPEIPAEVIS